MTGSFRSAIVAVGLLSLVACTSADDATTDDSVTTQPADATATPATTVGTTTDTAGAASTSDPGATSTTSTSGVSTTDDTEAVIPTTSEAAAIEPVPDTSADPIVAAQCETGAATPPADGPSAQLEAVGNFAGGTVYAAEYPVPDDLGEPWSQWGEGVVLPDGRFVSGVGDHRGQDGRSWFYEYDPSSRTLVQTTEVGQALGHERGDWGYGKLHAPMVLDACDEVVTSTYWGTRTDLVLGGSYSGDHLIRYDPSTREVTSLGVPIEGFGLPSLALSPDRATIYAEAVDPASDPDAGTFVAADATTGEVLATDRSPQHIGFRDILVTPEGDGLYAAGNGLAGFTAGGEALSEPEVFGGDAWLRSATPPASDGTVVIATREPDELWVRDASGDIRSLGALEDYVASLALTPDGATAYYVPGAHGQGAEFGTPLIAVDIDTGERTDVVRLNDLIEPEFGIQVGGSYNVAVDPGGERVFVGLNGGPSDEEEVFGDVVLAVIEFD